MRMSRRAFLAAGLAAGSAAASPFGRGHPALRTSFDFTVSSRSEIDALLSAARASPGSYSGKTVGVLDGNYGTTQIDATGIGLTSPLLFFSVNRRGPTLPGVACDGSAYLTWQRIKFARLRSVTGTTDDPTLAVCRVGFTGSSNPATPTAVPGFTAGGSSSKISFLDCEISADAMATADFNYYVGVVLGSGNGLSFLEGETINTSGGATGNYSGNLPRSSTTVFGILNSTGTSSQWDGKTITGAVSGATRTLSATANVSNVNFLKGISSSGSSPIRADDLVVEDCYIHDVKWPVATAGLRISYQRCTLEDCYISFGDFEGDISGSIIRDLRGSHIWATSTDGAPGTSGPHSSVFGFSQRQYNTSDVLMEGCVLCMGYRRLQMFGVSSFATGPKMNDQANQVTARVDSGTPGVTGNVLTVTAANLNGLNAPLSVGMAIRASVVGVADLPDGTTITALGTGTGGTGTYILSNSANISATTANLTATSVSSRWYVRSNLTISNGSIGMEFAYAKDCQLLYNSFIADQTNTGGFPSITWHDEYSGNVVAKNITCGFTLLAPGGQNSPDFFASAVDNVILKPFDTSGPASPSAMFNGLGVGGGNDFKLIDANNALQAYGPKAGGRVASGYGHAAYYNFTTRTSSYPTVPVAANSNVATGIDTSRVGFNGSTYARWTGTSGQAILEMTNGNQITVVMQVRMQTGSDGVDCTLFGGKNSAVVIRRLADGHLRFALNDTSTTVCLQIDTSFTIAQADGLTVISFSVDIPNYKAWASKGNHVDGFLSVTTWTGAPFLLVNGVNTVTIGANYSGSAFATFDAGVIAANDSYIDLSTDAGLGKVVAQDGRPPSYGSNGASLFGSAGRVAINGNAAAWNAGINGGTTAAKFQVTPANGLSNAA
jgi:hypothetical protein